MSAIQTLARSSTTCSAIHIKQLCRGLEESRTFLIFWIKGHSEIYGNELVDAFVNSAHLNGLSVHLPMSRTYIKREMYKHFVNV